MAKGSVRKKGKKWYYRFYVEDASGNLVQKEYAGTESKSETEKLLRQAMDDYESKKFIAKSENITVGELLDIWAEEELKTGTLSNGTVQNYLGAITNIKKHPISERKLKNVTSEHLQAFFDLLSFGGTYPDGSERKGYSKDYIRSFSAVLQQSFRFAVSPKQYITFNPMQYIKLKYQTDEVDLFSDDDMDGDIQPIPREDYERLIEFLQNYNPPAILPIQIAYYAGLRIGEACGLAWQDVNLEEQCLTIRRSIRYDGSRHKNIIGPTKRKKVRIVDFGDTLAEILRNARKEQLKNRMQYGELYHKNYYREVKDKNRVYYEFYHLDGTENVPEDYKEISFVCLRPDGSLELPSTLGIVCRKISQKLDGFEGFHFHQLRHTYTSNLLANGACTRPAIPAGTRIRMPRATRSCSITSATAPTARPGSCRASAARSRTAMSCAPAARARAASCLRRAGKTASAMTPCFSRTAMPAPWRSCARKRKTPFPTAGMRSKS